MEVLRELISPRELAKILKINPRTLANWRCSGRVDIPHFKIGGAVRYDAADVEKWIKDQRVEKPDGQ